MTRVPAARASSTEYRILDLVEPTSDGRGAIFAFREGVYPPAPDGEQPPSDYWLNVCEDDGRSDDGYDLYVDEEVARRLLRALLVRLGVSPGEYRENRAGGYTWDSDRVTLAAELLAPLLDDDPDLAATRSDVVRGVFGNEPF